MTVINTNTAATLTANALNAKPARNEPNYGASVNRSRINSASDDAAGLAISF